MAPVAVAESSTVSDRWRRPSHRLLVLRRLQAAAATLAFFVAAAVLAVYSGAVAGLVCAAGAVVFGLAA